MGLASHQELQSAAKCASPPLQYGFLSNCASLSPEHKVSVLQMQVGQSRRHPLTQRVTSKTKLSLNDQG